LMTVWHSNGNKSYESTFVNDKKYDLSIWWNENGNKRWVIPYKNSIEHGSRIRFNK